MKEWDVWTEGYQTGDDIRKAIYHGSIEAITFKAACRALFESDEKFSSFAMTYDGCKLYDNEDEAREYFG